MTRLAEILKRKITPNGPRSDEASSAAEYLARHARARKSAAGGYSGPGSFWARIFRMNW